MSEPASAPRPGRIRLMTDDTASSIDDAIKAMARLGPVRVTSMSVDTSLSTNERN